MKSHEEIAGASNDAGPRTSRLRLRRLTHEDTDPLLEIFADPLAMWAFRTKSRTETEDWIDAALASYTRNGWGIWAMERRSDARFAGLCGPMYTPVEGSLVPELGYHVVRSEWNKGYATEAAIACRDWFFANTGEDCLVSIVWPRNVASCRVADRVHVRKRLFVWEVSRRQEYLYETRRGDLTAAFGEFPKAGGG
jgi:[ribosomal protein S5]-alanine N-acetyltransferase